ncbi:MAG TPA: hypothetical protein PLX06_06375 [Fimbriimonadaceae bacterium]|nr:hypothetical protein [Fimbriimonadaceae bacterium]
MKTRLLCLAALTALTAIAPAAKPDSQRLNAIWRHVYDRMEKQNDAWFDQGDFPRCIQSLRLMNSVFPTDYESATSLGWLLESTEQYDEALIAYIKFGKDNLGHPEGPYPEANFYFMRRLYAKVPALLEPTIKQKPHPNSYRILAHSYEKLGLLADSKRVWDTYIELSPDDGAAKNNRARVEKKIKGEIPPAPAAR